MLNKLQGPSGQWADVMKRKRAIHENIINLVHEQQQSKSNKEKVYMAIAEIWIWTTQPPFLEKHELFF